MIDAITLVVSVVGIAILAFLLLIGTTPRGYGVQPKGKVKPYPPRKVGHRKSAIDRCHDGEMGGGCW